MAARRVMMLHRVVHKRSIRVENIPKANKSFMDQSLNIDDVNIPEG